MGVLDRLIANSAGAAAKSSLPMIRAEGIAHVTPSGKTLYLPTLPIDYSKVARDSGPKVAYIDVLRPAYSAAPGGAERAIDLAMRAQDRDLGEVKQQLRGWGVDPDEVAGGVPAYGRFDPLHAYVPREVRALRGHVGAAGLFNSRLVDPSGAVYVRDAHMAHHLAARAHLDSAVSHELRHSVMLDRQPDRIEDAFGYGSLELPVNSKQWLKDSGMGVLGRLLESAKDAAGRPSEHGYARYLSELAEIDARVPEIRQLFAYNTGRHVKNMDDARDAWNWYSRMGGSSPGISRQEFSLYDKAPPETKNMILRRMVAIPAVAGAIAAGAGDEQK